MKHRITFSRHTMKLQGSSTWLLPALSHLEFRPREALPSQKDLFRNSLTLSRLGQAVQVKHSRNKTQRLGKSSILCLNLTVNDVDSSLVTQKGKLPDRNPYRRPKA